MEQIIIATLIGLLFFIYLYECGNNKESFIDYYYHWDWNDPELIQNINRIDNSEHCKNCHYSVSCDFTDDALPWCYKSLDVPNRRNQTNSY